MFTDESDYIVEQYVKPQKVRKRLINDERADLLGNFDDDDSKFNAKKKPTKNVTPNDFTSEEDPFADAANVSDNEEMNGDNDESGPVSPDLESDPINDSDSQSHTENAASKNASNEPQASSSEPKTTKAKKSIGKSGKSAKNSPKPLTDDQIQALIRGCSKKDRFVLYITNLNYSTTRDALTEFFGAAGSVKSVRVPKVRRSAFAFVEMSDINGFKVSFILIYRMSSTNLILFYFYLVQ